MNILFKISQQTLWQILGKAISSLSTIVILGMVSRVYGESSTGILTLALTFLAFFALAVDFGINPHLLPQFLKDDISLQWRKLLGLRLALALVLVILAGGIIIFWPTQTILFKTITLLGLMSVVESAIFLTANIVFQARLRYDLSISGVLGMLITLGIIFYATKQNLTLPYLMLGYILGWIFSSLLALVFVKKYLDSIWPIFDIKYVKKMMLEVWPISATLVLNVVYFRLDAFLLSFFRGFFEVGVYNLSYQIFQSVLVIPTFIMNSFYPVMLRDFAQSFEKFKINLTKAVMVMVAIAILGALLTFTLSPLIINMITGGKGFTGSTTALQILSLSFPAFFISVVLMWTMIVLKKYRTMLIIYLIGLVFNALANLILIPQYSYLACAWITVASEYLILALQICILILIFNKKNLIYE